MAAYMVMFTFILLSPYYSLKMHILALPFIYWAVQTSTSKTALGVLYIYFFIYAVTYFLKDEKRSISFLRSLARWSFVCLLVPPLMMIVLHGANLGSLNPSLASLQDRIDNTWPGPFTTVAAIFPAGMLVGCGLGCFSYPMDYTNLADYNLPLDNFYLSTLIMMGLPFVLFIIMQVATVRFARDPVKLAAMTLFNFYSVTVQCYGPSYATLMIGYIFSEMFSYGHSKATRSHSRPMRGLLSRDAVYQASQHDLQRQL
jgi:hypothetical protein